MKDASPSPDVFGHFGGEAVHQVTLGKPDGLQAQIMTWGAALCNLTWPMPQGTRLPLILGFDTFAPYPTHSPYFGAVVGRYANRIAHGSFTYAGRTYHLDRNEAQRTTLHGGTNGFARRVWQIVDLDDTAVTLTLTSKDGDQGFPGTVDATCTYTLHADNRLDVQFTARTDRPTPVSLAQHAYFNLDGGPDISDHSLQIYAESYTPVGADQIPTGVILPVAETAFDFRTARPLHNAGSPFDHNFVLLAPNPSADTLHPAARLMSRKSGISMLVETTKPGLQFYDGHLLDVIAPGHSGRIYGARAGLCLETQYFPDSPNHPGFPDSILSPAGTYSHRTVFSFGRQDGAVNDSGLTA